MKNCIKLILFFALTTLTWSCNEALKKGSDSEKEVAKTQKAEKKNAEEKLLEKLIHTEPVDQANLEAWLPKTLGGLSLERARSFSLFKEAQMTGSYKRLGDKMITLSITDAAGPQGGMVASKINVFGTEPESDVETIQHRSVNVKGRMARQDYETEKNMTILHFFHKQRFMIMITAHDYNIEETWSLVDELDFEVLDNLMN